MLISTGPLQHDYGQGALTELVYWRTGIYVCFEEVSLKLTYLI